MKPNFTGEVNLFPEGCQNEDKKICHLKGQLTFVSPRDGTVWQTKEWVGESPWVKGKLKTGTTDGTSIPLIAQPFIGRPYDLSYLKAAIIHDHYCYEENNIRRWQDTHLMFYDALIALKVDKRRAKLMYFAVYSFGPKWKFEEKPDYQISFKDGISSENLSGIKSYALAPSLKDKENEPEINLMQSDAMTVKRSKKRKKPSPTIIRTKKENYDSKKFKQRVSDISEVINTNPEITLEELEAMAREYDPKNFQPEPANLPPQSRASELWLYNIDINDRD